MSEFRDYVNSSIFVEIGTSALQADDWGNSRPQTETLEIKTFLKELRGNSQTRPAGSLAAMQGSNTMTTYLKGYLVEPMDWPDRIVPQFCEVDYLGRRGKLQVFSQLPRAFDTEKMTGTVVEGLATFQL